MVETKRKLAAILAADVSGYSRLMGDDERATVAALNASREIFRARVSEHDGRVVDTAGDSVLATFDSVVEAVQCASEVQTALGERNRDLPDDRRMAFRIGVNLGDVIEQDDGTIYGDGVNVAARLEGLAEPGGICLSGSAHEQVEGKTDYEFEDIGEHEVKNIARPVRAYRIMGDGQAGSTEPTKSLALPDKPSIAVLPFDNMSGDPEQEYFADGIAEAITAALSRIRSFFVIARNSAFTFKGRSANVLDIGRELGVAYVLEGSVQRAGQRLRITAQLVETDGGAHVWADHYDGTIDNIFDLQDLITELVAGALQPSIRIAEIERARRKRPQDLSAYDYTMRAMPHVWSLEKEGSARALTLLDKALSIEPDYPLALSLAAWCHAQHSVYNWVDDIPRSQSQALELAEKSVELSGNDPLILAVLGTVHTFVRNFGTARVLLERALALDPNAAWAYSRLGWLETYSDHSEIALGHFERALRLSPLDPMNFNNFVGMGSAHQVAQDYDKAIALFKRALEERPHADWIYRNLTPALVGGGYMEEASDAYAHLIDHYPDLTVEKIEQAMIFSRASLERMVENLKKLGLPD